MRKLQLLLRPTSDTSFGRVSRLQRDSQRRLRLSHSNIALPMRWRQTGMSSSVHASRMAITSRLNKLSSALMSHSAIIFRKPLSPVGKFLFYLSQSLFQFLQSRSHVHHLHLK
jgi:hypothetical protein